MDNAKASEQIGIGAGLGVADGIKWGGIIWRVDKYAGDLTPADIASGRYQPYESKEVKGNLLMYGGASCLWQCLVGNGTGTAGQTLTFFNNGNSYLGAGDSSTAESASHTDLQAATNKLRKAMDATYPTHTDGVVVGAKTITFKSTFGSSDANWAWNEVGTFNGSTGGRMLNRKVGTWGTKANGTTWVLTETIDLA